MKRLFLAAAFFMFASGGAHADSYEIENLIASFNELSNSCVDGNDACRKQFAILNKLKQAGTCISSTETGIEFLPCELADKKFAERKRIQEARVESDRNPKDKFTGCIFSGGIFQHAAVFRDHGLSPEEALRTMKPGASEGKFGISIEFIKKAINLVYFDPGFTYASGDALAAQIRTLCMRDWKPQFQPLK